MSAPALGSRPRVLVITDDRSLERIVRELLTTMIPAADVEASTVADAPLVKGDYAIIDHAVCAVSAFTVAQELRARGFEGGLVLLHGPAAPELDQRLPTIAPARSVRRGDLVEGLPRALGELTASSPPGGELAGVERDLRRAQRVMARGEVTARIQHTLNNPLTALLAEAQLLEMEPMAADHLAGIRRIIDQARRVVAMVRGLDDGPRPSGVGDGCGGGHGSS